MDVSLPPVETPLPAIDVDQPLGRGPPRDPCLSYDYGSEANDAFPNALPLDAATAPSRGNFARETSRRIVGLIRGSKSSSSPAGRASLPREDIQDVEDATSGKQDAERVAVIPSRPTPPRSSVNGSRRQERVSIARKLSKFLGFDGARASGGKSSDVPEDAAAPLADWKPHEKILKMLGYRPRGYGQPFTNRYTLGEVLGMGGFGVVREGTHKPDGEVLAVKVISRDAVKDMDSLAQEVDTLRRLDHHQVVRFIDFYEEPQTFFLVLEKVPGGELFDRIVAEGKFMEESARACMRSLLEALAYCHSQKIAHRDIKPENILFASLDAKDRTVKLSDFGLARSVERGLIAGTPCGTPSYMAPESIRLMPHGTQVDCWGVGVVTHILLCGFPPFNSLRTEKLFRLIKKGRVSFEDGCWRSVSRNAMDFVLALLRVDPDTRLTAEQALQHPWLIDAVEEAEEGEQELGAAMTKLRTFNAKRKLRVAIRTLIAFQQLEGSASSMEIGVARPPLYGLEAAKPISFLQLHSRAVAIADALTGAEGRGSQRPATPTFTVAILCGKSDIAEICAVLAVILAGGCFVPIDDKLPLPRLSEVFRDAQPDAIVTTRSFLAGERTAGVCGIPAVIEQQGCQILHLEDSGKPSKFRETVDTFREGEAQDENGESEKSIGKHSCGKRVPRSSACTASTAARHANVVPDDEGPVADEGLSSLAGQACPGPSEHDTRPTAASESKGLADSGLYDRKELDPCPVPRDEEDLLYILYTSGTTGPQKGVRGTRSGAVNRILFGWSLCPFRGDGELVCRRTPSCFVDFVAEVFCPLLAGIPLFVPTAGAHADPLLLAPALAEAKATRITLTPSLLASMLRTTSSDTETLLPDVHTWIISGEALHPDLALLFRRRAAQGAQLINLYGSTEVSGDATFCTLDDIIDTEKGCAGFRPSGDMGVLIGKPLPGVHVSVVGTDLTPVPIGQAGELLVGGVGVALGYHRAPQEATTKFLHTAALSTIREREDVVHMPGLKAGSRVVRTGDRVVQPVADGPLFWLGKMDGEVKVRGVRVSLEEVEVVACRASGLPAGAFAVAYDLGMDTDGSAVGDSNAVTKAAIASRSPDRGRLWGFFESNGLQVNNEGLAKLRLQLAAVLTTVQLPAVLVPVVGRFPLTTSGKVDKRALLREHRKQVEALDGRPVASAEGVDAYLPYPKDPTCQNMGTLAAARGAVARAVVSVLPDARASIASWLRNLEESAPGSSNCSGMTFGGLGGTSLLAVEAAWRTLRSAGCTVAGSTITPVPPTSMLTANDFLGGTLEDAASTLHGILEKERHAEETKTSSGTANGRAAAGLAATGAGQHKPLVPPAGPGLLSPAAADASAAGFQSTSSTGRKRQRLDFEKRDQTTHSRSFLALGRGASGLRKTVACLGEVGDRVGDGSGLKGARADLGVRWSSCFTKCIDATPLVFLPKSKQEIVGRSRTGGVDNAGGMVAEAPSQFASPESVGPSSSCPSVAGTQRLGGRVREGGKSTTCGDALMSTSHVSSGTVYIGSHSGEFQALDLETGDREWSFTAGGRIESGAACSCDGSTIFVGCHDGHLYAIDRRMGILLWSFETGDAIKCTPVCMPEALSSDLTDRGARKEGELVDRGTVVFGSHDGVLRSLWEADGVLRWTFDCGGALFASPAHDAEARVVYAATTKGRVVALDNSALVVFVGTEAASSVDHNRILPGSSTTQPTLLWDTYLPAPVFSSPAVCSANGIVVLGCVDGGMYCVSSVGEQVWVCRRGDKPVFSSPCILPPPCKEMGGDANNASGMRVIWGCHDGAVRCRSGVDLAWETDVGRGQPVFSSPCFAAVACEGCALLCPLVFACSVPGLISALCLADGEILGEVQLPGEIFSSAVVAGPSVVVGCRDNRVYVLDILVTCPQCVQTKAVATVC